MWQNFQSPPSLRNLDSYQPPIQVSLSGPPSADTALASSHR